MGEIPTSDEWKKVDRGKRLIRLRRQFANRQTLMVALRVLALAVQLARFIFGLDDV